MKSIKKLFTALFIILAFTFTTTINAQGIGNADGSATGSDQGDHGDGTGNPGNDKQVGNTGNSGGSTSIPLDGGLSILLLGAAAFGIKKLRQK